MPSGGDHWPQPRGLSRVLQLSFPPARSLLSLGLCGWELCGVFCPVPSNLVPMSLSDEATQPSSLRVRGCGPSHRPGDTQTKPTPVSRATASVEPPFPRDDTRSLGFPLTVRDLPERYRVRVFFRTWPVASRGLFWSVFWLLWAKVLRRLARWQGPRPDPQGAGFCVAWGELATLGDGVEAGSMAIGLFCFPEPGEDLFPGFASLLGREQPSPWSRVLSL